MQGKQNIPRFIPLSNSRTSKWHLEKKKKTKNTTSLHHPQTNQPYTINISVVSKELVARLWEHLHFPPAGSREGWRRQKTDPMQPQLPQVNVFVRAREQNPTGPWHRLQPSPHTLKQMAAVPRRSPDWRLKFIRGHIQETQGSVPTVLPGRAIHATFFFPDPPWTRGECNE